MMMMMMMMMAYHKKARAAAAMHALASFALFAFTPLAGEEEEEEEEEEYEEDGGGGGDDDDDGRRRCRGVSRPGFSRDFDLHAGVAVPTHLAAKIMRPRRGEAASLGAPTQSIADAFSSTLAFAQSGSSLGL